MMSSNTPSVPRSVATPCVQVCIVDGPSGLCLGCFRTLPEIGRWSRMTDEERAVIMSELADRADKIEPAKLGR